MSNAKVLGNQNVECHIYSYKKIATKPPKGCGAGETDFDFGAGLILAAYS
jgi:hypothetical protein